MPIRHPVTPALQQLVIHRVARGYLGWQEFCRRERIDDAQLYRLIYSTRGVSSDFADRVAIALGVPISRLPQLIVEHAQYEASQR